MNIPSQKSKTNPKRIYVHRRIGVGLASGSLGFGVLMSGLRTQGSGLGLRVSSAGLEVACLGMLIQPTQAKKHL